VRRVHRAERADVAAWLMSAVTNRMGKSEMATSIEAGEHVGAAKEKA
jgi:hypothetical protein